MSFNWLSLTWQQNDTDNVLGPTNSEDSASISYISVHVSAECNSTDNTSDC